jgi:MscS family membrane protein
MNAFLNRIIWGNTVEDYLWTLGAILFVLILNKVISRAIAWFSCRLFKKQWQTFDRQKFTDLIVHPLGLFLVITVTIVAFYRLHYPPELRFTIYKYPLQKVLLSIAIAVQIFSFVWVVLRIVDFIAAVLHKRADITEARNEVQLIVFFRDFIKVLIGVIGIVLVLNQAFGYNVSSLLTGLSIVGAAIALALRESLENLIASFVIFFDKPFTTGDFVKVQNIGGVIERIGLRSTRLRTVDKSYVTVPNKQMVDSILENVSLRSQLRGETNLFLHHSTPPAKIEQLLTELRNFLNTIPEVDTKNVLLNDIRIQGFHVFIEYFTPQMEWSSFTGIKQRVNIFILQAMEAMEIRMAEPKEPS